MSQICHTQVHISPDVEVGSAVTFESKGTCDVIAFAGEGRSARVYQVKHQSGFYTLKIAKDRDERSLLSVKRAYERICTLQACGVECATPIEVGQNYLLKEWVDGQSLHEWVIDWQTKDCAGEAIPIRSMIDMITKLANKGIYVGDLSFKNILWDSEGRYIVIDSGRVRKLWFTAWAWKKYFKKYAFVTRRFYNEAFQAYFKAALENAKKGISTHQAD